MSKKTFFQKKKKGGGIYLSLPCYFRTVTIVSQFPAVLFVFAQKLLRAFHVYIGCVFILLWSTNCIIGQTGSLGIF